MEEIPYDKIRALIRSAEVINIELAVQIGLGFGLTEDETLHPWGDLLRQLQQPPQTEAELLHQWLASDKLSLLNRKLGTIPSGIGGFTQLTELNLNVNALAQLPEDIGDLENLKILRLNRNHLTDLPASFEQLQNLDELWLSDNQFSRLPEVIYKMKQLKVLVLSYNQLTSIGGDIAQLTQLERLDLYNNPIEKETKVFLKRLLPDCKLRFVYRYEP